MSSFWKSKLQNTVQGLNANLTDSAARLRQQLLQPTTPGGGTGTGGVASQQLAGANEGAQQEPQYVRLPVESAKKLRWFDRQDLNMLIQLHLREKQELFEANAALRQALQRRGVTEAQLESEVVLNNAHVDRLKESDTAVGEVLVLAAQAEVERLKEEVAVLSSQLDHMRQRLLAASQPAAASLAITSSAPAEEQLRREPAEQVVLQLHWVDDGDGGGGRASVQLSVQPGKELSPTFDVIGVASIAPLLQQLARASQASDAASGIVSVNPSLILQAYAALQQLAAQQGVELDVAGATSTEGTEASNSVAEPGVRVASTGTGEAMGSPSRVHGGAATVLRERCAQLEARSTRLQSELAQAQQEASLVKDAADRQVQELRARFAASQGHLQELLRVAQDGRLEAEARCEAAERRVQLAEARAGRMDSEALDLKAEAKRASQEAKRFEKEALAAEARAAAAEASLQRAKGVAEADVRSIEVLAQQRGRVAELEAQVGAQHRQLAASQRHVHALEEQLAAAAAEAARAAEELREAESVAAERDQLAARLTVLEARMDETRVERSQLESARAVAAECESKRARAEQELVATAGLAAALEARLVEAQRRAEALQWEVQAAEAARQAAVKSVAAEVAQRWKQAGAERSQWPPLAQQELENLEIRMDALLTALKTAQEQAAQDTTELERTNAKLAAAQKRLAELDESHGQQQKEWQARERQLEATSTAATIELADLRRAVGEVGRERDRLLEEKQARERAAAQAAAAVKAARRRTGSGSIADAALANGGSNGPIPAPSLSRSSTLGSDPGLPPPSHALVALRGQPRETLDATDLLYLKNVLLKFLEAHLAGRGAECDVLLPAVATLLRASPQEFRVLREGLQRGTPGYFSGSWFGTGTAGGGG